MGHAEGVGQFLADGALTSRLPQPQASAAPVLSEFAGQQRSPDENCQIRASVKK